MNAYRSFCAHLSERRKPRRKLKKMKNTSYQYTYFTLTVVEITKQNTCWNGYACPVASQVADCRNEDPNLRESMRQCGAWSGLLHGNSWLWSNGKMVTSRGKPKIRAEKPAEVSRRPPLISHEVTRASFTITYLL
jgi:hypothetical protein